MALTELKSILSNFRKPMASNPLEQKGKDKTSPVVPTQEDQTTKNLSQFSPKNADKNLAQSDNAKLLSNVKIVKLGIFEDFPTPQIAKPVITLNNESSNIKLVTADNGTFNNVSSVKVTPSTIGTNNLSSNTNITPAEVGTNNLISNTNITPAANGTNNLNSNIGITPAANGTNNLTTNFKTINVAQDRLISIMNSILNIDGIPVTYTVSDQLLRDNSNLNFDTPIVYSGESKLTVDVSNQNFDYIPTKYINTPSLLQFGTAGPGLSIGASNLDVDSIPNRYQNIVNLGQFNPVNTGQSLLDNDSIPNKYQNIVNLGQFNPFNTGQSLLDIDAIPTQYQNIVNLGQFNPANTAQSLLDIDSNLTKYVNIVGNGQFNNDATIIGNRWSGPTPPAVNFFAPDTMQGAKGFTVQMVSTQYETVTGTSYGFTNTIQKPLLNGVAKLDAQLGPGSLFYYTDAGAIKTKPFTEFGYSAGNRYGDVVKSNKSNPNDSLLYKLSTEENSPSAIDLQYAKFNLQDDSYNPWYIPQPYVLRGPQRKSSKELQRWGGSALADDGLIRGGFAAAAERSTFDLVRLGQWIASPKGLLWVVKQVGLGLSNPIVESVTPIIGQTRIHTGLTSLLSVPTTAFGLHFTRHGLPFANAVDDYENVQKFNSILGPGSRLSLLKSSVFGPIPLINNQLFSFNPLGQFGGPNSVYGIGFTRATRVTNTTEGVLPNLDILVKTSPLKGLENVGSILRDINFIPIYSIGNQYASTLSKARINTAMDDTNKNSVSNIELQSSLNTGERSSLKTRTENNSKPVPIREAYEVDKPNPFERKSDISAAGSKDPTLDTSPYTDAGDIRNYQTLAYSKLTRSTDKFQDFRKDIGSNSSNKSFLGDFDTAKYSEKNLEKLGWGEQGKIGADRSKYKEPSKRGDRVNLIDIKRNVVLDAPLAKGNYSKFSNDTRDFIAFYFAGPNHHTDGNGDDVMIFRANIQGFSDSLSPDWSPINIMGRADKAYLYTGFDRSISFTMTVAATSREEMQPMWTKINYLASYTMPDYNAGGRMLGPFMRLTIGNLFQNTPGFIESLSISIPDDATWEINLDEDPDMKQLPMMAEISITYKVLADYRPQKNGRVYSLSKFGQEGGDTNNWLTGDEAEGKDTKNVEDTKPKEPSATTTA